MRTRHRKNLQWLTPVLASLLLGAAPGCMQEMSRREVTPHHFDSSVPISASTLKQEPEPTAGEKAGKATGNFMKESWRQVSTLFGLIK